MASPLPGFTDEGLLPPGDYELTFEELRKSVLVEGPRPASPWGESWDAEWRSHLSHQAETMCNQLWSVGIEDIYLDGSFTEAKTHPNGHPRLLRVRRQAGRDRGAPAGAQSD
ncbi:DUF6932 family protein [Salinibacter altiplanensis]|uniref:DUF6932 family protein n=1 Tax=Salinibacter altiplanensis TaxID=1803181 RepID=UPI003C6E2349